MFKAKFNYLSFKRVFKWKIHLTQITCKMNWKWNRKREELEELKEEEEEDKKQTANELNLKWIKLPSLHLYTRSVCIIGTDVRIELQSKNSVSISLIRLVFLNCAPPLALSLLGFCCSCSSSAIFVSIRSQAWSHSTWTTGSPYIPHWNVTHTDYAKLR